MSDLNKDELIQKAIEILNGGGVIYPSRPLIETPIPTASTPRLSSIICEDCGKNIPPERIKVFEENGWGRPDKCVVCQTKAVEKGRNFTRNPVPAAMGT